MMMKVNLKKVAKLWLLAAVLIMPRAGIAEQADITVDALIPEGRFVIFYLTNYEEQDFHCAYIRVKATVKDRHEHVVALRSIIARNVALPAGAMESHVEAGKKMIQVLENQFDQPRIVGVSDLRYRCEPKKTQVFRDRLKDGSQGPEMVWIPAGSFRMGDLQGGGGSDEKPIHRVSVGRFAMGRYEVTFAEYDRFAQATGREKTSDSGWGRGNRPVINVSWYDATAYAEWLSQQTGHKYRLPTEAEWEYAARAGTETKYWWGNDIGSNKANCYRNYCGDSFEYTAPVGSFAANSFGLYDTVGNVWEWTCSLYEDKYTGKEQQCLIKSPSKSSHFVLRGGSWYNGVRWARSAGRNWRRPAERTGSGGFRLARRP
ncbi:MAG: formylglycine-generating enzyme family protein [Pseudomonadota bacterium]